MLYQNMDYIELIGEDILFEGYDCTSYQTSNVTSQSADTANNFMKQTAALAQASGVAPKDVLNDMPHFELVPDE